MRVRPSTYAALAMRHLVGRAPMAQLVLPDPTVSGEHAAVYFDGYVWKVRDLGSRNGTFLNGERLIAAQSRAIRAGDELRFGSSAGPAWCLECAAPPGPSARHDGGRLGAGDAGLWIPDARSALARIVFSGGAWLMEDEQGARKVRDTDEIRVGGIPYQLELPPFSQEDCTRVLQSTAEASSASPVRLLFHVSRDEEHVSLEVVTGKDRVSLGAKAHNYPILVLARRRLEDAQRGLGEGECGWVYPEELSQLLGLDRKAMNLQLWRAARAFQTVRNGPDSLVERRPDSLQLRLGIAACSVQGC